MRLVLVALTAPLLAACAPTELPEGGITVPRTSGDGTCKADPAQHHVGTRASTELGSTILEQSGARQLRWGGPDTVFTMDYREDRVNVIYDDYGIIERITCG